MNPDDPAEHSLDPGDWEAFRLEAHRALDMMVDHIRDIGSGPVWRPPPNLPSSGVPLPREGAPLPDVLDQFATDILPYGTGNLHPRFFGWVHGAGTPVGMVAEMLAAGMNANCGGRDHAGIAVERQLAGWMAELFGFPADSSGLCVTGTSMANLIAIRIAHQARGGGGDAVGYTSVRAHSSIARAFSLLSLGDAALRAIPADEAGRLRIDLLTDAIDADRRAGLRPFLVAGTAGSAIDGAIDDLEACAALCARESLWFHVDGAFGALAMLSPELRPLLAGLERADTIAFDFHKWLHVPYDAGFILCRHPELHRAAFGTSASYLDRLPRGLATGETWPCDLGPDLSRGFRALKVWMTFRHYGAARLGMAISQCCALARDLAARIEGNGLFELRAEVPLNIVCFGVRGSDGAVEREIVMALQERGIAVPSTVEIDGRTAIRCAIVNHRTTQRDIAAFAAHADAIARERPGTAA